MRTAFAILIGAIALGCSSADRPLLSSDRSPANAPATRPTLASLREHPVVGLLGLPLGTVAEVQATIIAGSELRMKAYDGIYLLRVTQVAGRQLDTPVNIEFTVRPFGDAKLPREASALYEMKTGNKATQLDSKEISELEKAYVGTQKRLLAFETGGYSGIPRDLPRNIFSWQDHSFAFLTSLIVLEERR